MIEYPTGTVTFLFTDIQGSTPLWEQLPEVMRAAVALHHTLLRQAIEANGGIAFKIIGDAVQEFWMLDDVAIEFSQQTIIFQSEQFVHGFISCSNRSGA